MERRRLEASILKPSLLSRSSVRRKYNFYVNVISGRVDVTKGRRFLPRGS